MYMCMCDCVCAIIIPINELGNLVTSLRLGQPFHLTFTPNLNSKYQYVHNCVCARACVRRLGESIQREKKKEREKEYVCAYKYVLVQAFLCLFAGLVLESSRA